MRTIIFFSTAFLVFNSLFCQKQNSINYIEVDYLSDTNISYDEYQRVNSLVGIKILNINKKLVDINSNVEKKSFNQDVPKLFETFSNAEIPDGETNDVSAFNSKNLKFISPEDIEKLKVTNAVKVKLAELITKHESIYKKISRINKSLVAYGIDYRRVKTILNYHKDILRIQETCDMKFDTIIKLLNLKTQSTFSIESTGIEKEDRKKLDDKLQKTLGNEILDEKSKYVEYKGIVSRLVEKIINESDAHAKSLTNELLPSNIDLIQTEIKTFNNELKNVLSDLKRVKDDNEIKKFLNEFFVRDKLQFALQDLLYKIKITDLEKVKEDFDNFKTNGKLDLIKAYEYFNESNYSYYLTPERVEKDLTILKIEISPKENVPCSPKAKVYEFSIKPKGGLKIDFSTGLFGNFGGNDFLDQSYRYESVENEPDNSKIVRNDTKNTILPSVGALMHIYPRQTTDIKWAGTFGISTTELESVNYHFGGSLIIGYSTRLIISGGISLSKTELIADDFEVGQIVETANAPDEIPTDSFNRFGYFISFTYNLSK